MKSAGDQACPIQRGNTLGCRKTETADGQQSGEVRQARMPKGQMQTIISQAKGQINYLLGYLFLFRILFCTAIRNGHLNCLTIWISSLSCFRTFIWMKEWHIISTTGINISFLSNIKYHVIKMDYLEIQIIDTDNNHFKNNYI